MATTSLVPIFTQVWIRNEAGTLQHRFTNTTDNGTVSLSETPINLATSVWQPLPDGLTTTPFTTGAKISNSFSDAILFDTEPQKAGSGGILGVLTFNSTGTDIVANGGQSEEEVVGVTQRRTLLQFLTVPGGMAFPINTTNIPTGTQIIADLVGSILA